MGIFVMINKMMLLYLISLVNVFGNSLSQESDQISHYSIHGTALKANDAQKDCASRHGNLVSITSEKEFDFVNSLTPEVGPFYIGLSQPAFGAFKWADGSDFDFESWMDHDVDGRECVVMKFR